MFDNLLKKIHILIEKNKNHLTMQLLEPLSTIIRLSMLYFKTQGTKIAIYNNRIISHKPNIMQGTIRWTFGNKRNELYYLYRPILIAMLTYNISDDNSIQTIFDYAIKGLEKLKKTYEETNGTIICHSIDLYKKIIQNKLQNKTNKNNLSCDDLTNKLYTEFKLLWNDKKHIQIISDLLLLCEKTKDVEQQKSFLNSIDLIIKVKEKKSLLLISDATKNIKS